MKQAGDQIGELTLGGETFPIFQGLGFTITRLQEQPPRPSALWRAWAAAQGTDARNKPVEPLMKWLLGEAQLRWYELQKRTPPAACVTNQAQRRQEVEMTKAQEKAIEKIKEERKERGPTIGSIIKEDILKGKGTEEILKHVRSRFDGCKTTEKDVAYYRYQLRKAGDIPAYAPAHKAEKAKAEKKLGAKGKSTGKKKSGKKAGGRKLQRSIIPARAD